MSDDSPKTIPFEFSTGDTYKVDVTDESSGGYARFAGSTTKPTSKLYDLLIAAANEGIAIARKMK